MLRTCFLLLAGLALLIGLSGMGAAQKELSGEELAEREKLFLTTCNQCHDSARICNKVGRTQQFFWENLFRKHNGLWSAGLSSRTVDKMAEYLSSLPRGAKPMCK